MTTEELTAVLASTDIDKAIERLKGRTELPDIAQFKKEYSPTTHEVFDKIKRKDHTVTKQDPLDKTKEIQALVEINRIPLALQKTIVRRAVSFLFGNPVEIRAKPKGKGQAAVLTALNRILYDNKVDSFNRVIARSLFRTKQTAEIWFSIDTGEVHSDYGFDTKFRIRVMSLSPWDGNELYPLFDETGDMIAFSRAYTFLGEENKELKGFEIYTKTERIVYRQETTESGMQWAEPERTPNAIKKIPVSFGHQEDTEWADVQVAIERLETLLSNFAETNDYHAAPKYFVEGKILGFSQKGQSNGVLEGSVGAKVTILSWAQATDSVKLEIETLLRFIFTFTQTPDISFESVKSIGQIATETLRLLFLDAHLKVQDKREIVDAYLQRRASIIKGYLGMMNTKFTPDDLSLQIDSEIKPFMINDLKGLIDTLTTATAGKAVLSQKTAVAQTGLVEDADAEFKLIQTEQVVRVTEPTF